MKRTQKVIVITTQNQDDNKLIENAIRANKRFKELTLKVPEKRLARIILYNVDKQKTEGEVLIAFISQTNLVKFLRCS